MKYMIKTLLISIYQSLNRKLFTTNWKDFRRLQPISTLFGTDRGKPIDRFYIEKFLHDHADLIRGTVIEIGDDTYSSLFSGNISKMEILHFTDDNPKASLVGDLTDIKTLVPDLADCFICTQTLNFIYDFKAAVKGIHYLMKENGHALVTLSGISQISRYDMDRWGDFWRFTDKSAKQIFSDVFGEENVNVYSYGNVLSAVSFLQGISAEELTSEELLYNDNNYQLTITVLAKKTG